MVIQQRLTNAVHRYLLNMFLGLFIALIMNVPIQMAIEYFGLIPCNSWLTCTALLMLGIVQLLVCGLIIDAMGDYQGNGNLGFFTIGLFAGQTFLLKHLITGKISINK